MISDAAHKRNDFHKQLYRVYCHASMRIPERMPERASRDRFRSFLAGRFDRQLGPVRQGHRNPVKRD